MADRSMHVIKGLPSDLLDNSIVGFRRLKTESESTFDNSVLTGAVFSFSHQFNITSSDVSAINFYTNTVAAIRRISIYADTDVEAAIFDAHATGTEGDAIIPENINLCSNRVTGSTARPITTANVSGTLKDLGVNELLSPLIFCTDNEVSIALRRLTNGASSVVRVVVLFEELDDLALLIGIKPLTPWLDSDPWLDAESWSD